MGVFEAFYNSLKPIQLVRAWPTHHVKRLTSPLFLFSFCLLGRQVNFSVEIRPSGKLPPGKTEIPFELPLRSKAGQSLYETYHGVFVNIQVLNRR